MLRLSPPWIALACAIHLNSTVLAAPAIWRCGNSFSDLPCEDGKQIETQAPPSVQERKRRDEDTLHDLAAAERMQRERLALEAQPRGAAVIGAQGRQAPAGEPQAVTLNRDKKKKHRARTAQPDAFIASYADPNASPADKKRK